MTSGFNEAAVVYWVLALVLAWLPRVLYRGSRLFEKWEIDAAHARHARALKRYPYLAGAFGVMLLGGLILGLRSAGAGSPWAVHLLGVVYGGFLALDASFAWRTVIRIIPAVGRRLHAIDEGRTWKAKLLLALAGTYLGMSAVLLLVAL